MGVFDFLTDRGKRTRELLTGDARRPSPADQADEEYQKLFADFIYGGMYSREVVPQNGCFGALMHQLVVNDH